MQVANPGPWPPGCPRRRRWAYCRPSTATVCTGRTASARLAPPSRACKMAGGVCPGLFCHLD
jgi:hypothetical protein